MYVLEEYVLALLLSVALTACCALAALAGWGAYRLISSGRRLISHGWLAATTLVLTSVDCPRGFGAPANSWE